MRGLCAGHLVKILVTRDLNTKFQLVFVFQDNFVVNKKKIVVISRI